MAEGEGLRKASLLNDLHSLTQQNPTIEAKGFSRGLSNREHLPLQEERAAAAGPRNGSETAYEVSELPRQYTADQPAHATPMCVTCKWARPFPEVEKTRWGASLQTRIPAFVRLCQLHSPRNMLQLVNTFWACGQWEGRE